MKHRYIIQLQLSPAHGLDRTHLLNFHPALLANPAFAHGIPLIGYGEPGKARVQIDFETSIDEDEFKSFLASYWSGHFRLEGPFIPLELTPAATCALIGMIATYQNIGEALDDSTEKTFARHTEDHLRDLLGECQEAK